MPVLDLDYAEDSNCDTDMNVVMNDGGGFIEVQGTAEGHAFRRDEMDAMLNLAEKGIAELVVLQRAAWKADMQRIVLASSNHGKLAEFNALLADSQFEVVPQAELGVEDAEETGLTFVENALLKARHASQVTGLPALADDSGLCVAHLRGAPGLYSARYSGAHGDTAANNTRLLRELDGVPSAQRSAFLSASSRCFGMPTIRPP